MPDPNVSVIIPAYNEARSLPGVLSRVKSSVDGLGTSYELLVVDDGSTDGTSDAAKAAGATVIRHPVNIGNGAAVTFCTTFLFSYCNSIRRDLF